MFGLIDEIRKGSSGVQWGPVGSRGVQWGPVGLSGVQWGRMGSSGVAQRAAPNAPPSFSRIVTSRPNPLPPSSTPDSWSPKSRRGPPQMQMTPHIPDRARIGGDRSKSSNYAFISLLLSCFLTRLIRLAQKGSHSICFREVVVSQPRGFPGAWPVGSRAMFPNERS